MAEPCHDADELERWLEDNLPRVSRLPFREQLIRARHVLNWGGFVNHSFSIIAGAATYHLKISDDQDSVDGLRQWYELRHVLEDRFRAPAVIEWVELGEIGFAGLLMKHVEGRAPALSM